MGVVMIGSPLYKRDSAGRLREWRMEYDGRGSYRTIAGLADGNQAVSDWTLATPKNQGRANETNAIQQAALEVDAAYADKLKREYFLTIAETDTPRFFKPMLAQKYEGLVPGFPVYSQPKLDGIRCIASAKGLSSREGQPILSCPHISAALAPFFEIHPDAVLDGELYNHDLHDDFNEIVSIVKREKCSPAQLAKSAALAQYHVYDWPSHGAWGFDRRSDLLESELEFADDCIVSVVTHMASDQAALDRLYADYLEQGYEGQMVRLDLPYEQKRSKSLLKRKEFLDAEFPLVAIEEGLGNWAGVAKRVTFTLPDGRTCGAGIRGTKDRAKTLLHETYDSVTVRYFALTPDGMPRFPVVTAFHNGVRL
jgi:DNA ligase-1